MTACRVPIEALERRVMFSAAPLPLQGATITLQPIVLGTDGASMSQAIAAFTGAEGEVGQPTANLPVANVRWGDGKSDRADPTAFDSLNRLIVAPSHVYHRAGVFAIAVILVQNKKTVGHALERIQVLSVSPGGLHLGVSPGQSFSGDVGQFTANYPVIESNTVINWGDRSTSPPDSIQRVTADQYDVTSSHTYRRAGTYRIVVSSKVGAPSIFNTDVASVIMVKKSRTKIALIRGSGASI
jgi:hypothetical protein